MWEDRGPALAEETSEEDAKETEDVGDSQLHRGYFNCI